MCVVVATYEIWLVDVVANIAAATAGSKLIGKLFIKTMRNI